MEWLVCSGGNSPRSRIMVVVILCSAIKLSILAYINHRIDFDDWYNVELPFFNGMSVSLSLYKNPLLRVPEFLLGVVLPHLAPQRISFHTQSDKGTSASGGECATISVEESVSKRPAFIDMLVLGSFGYMLLVPYTPRICNLMNNNAMFLMQALLLWNLCWQPLSSYIGRLLSTPILVWYGELTYGIYLFQLQVLANDYPWGSKVGWPGPNSMVGSFSSLRLSFLMQVLMELVIATIIAWTLRKVMEEPISDLIRWSLSKTK